jgi:hypothetical protein
MAHAQERKPLFTVERKDLDVQFFRASGPGGQKVNKTSSACRIVHTASGAIGESREHRSQTQNKKAALERLAGSERFMAWVRMRAAAVLQGYRSMEEKVERMLAPPNLRVEELTTYICDGCKRRKQIVGSLPPEGWLSFPVDEHYCPECVNQGRCI